MKKIIYFTLSFLLLFLITIDVSALNKADEIWDNLNSETKEYLEELGIDEISFDELFELSPTRVLKFIFNVALNKTRSLKESFILIFIILMLSSIVASFIKQSDKFKKIIDYACNLIIMSFIMVPIGKLMTDAATVIKNTTVFINIYLPVMSGIIVASKSPALASLMAFDDLMIAGIAMNPPNMPKMVTVTIAFIIRVRASLASVSGLYMVFCFLFVYTIM